MDVCEVVGSQHGAALDMLKQTNTRYPDLVWDDPNDPIRTWRIACHALSWVGTMPA